MRTRTYSTRKLTYLPNAQTLGYGKWKASSGDYITTKNGEFGRVLGVITNCDADGLDCRGHLVVTILSNDLTFGYERWIDPKDVFTCKDPKHVNNFMTCFLASNVKETEAALKANDCILAGAPDGKLWDGGEINGIDY